MERRFPASAIATGVLLALAAAPAWSATPPGDPVLQLAGDDFPELAVHVPRYDAEGRQAALDCNQIRAKRIDELDPLWKRAVERIHLDCDDLSADYGGDASVATMITAYLKPDTVRFAGLVVREVRLMDSDLWGDHQYVLDVPYSAAVETVREHIESRCAALWDDPTRIASSACVATLQEGELYMSTGEVSSVWLHPDRNDPGHTVYAEAWSD